MARRRGVVWIAEEVEWDDDGGGSWLTARFWAHHDTGRVAAEVEGVSAEDAIAWGRERADTVHIRLGRGEYHTAGAVPTPDLEPWPPPDLPPLVRRRPPADAWRDRTATDPPIAWAVQLSLHPADWSEPDRAHWDCAIAELAGAAGAEGWDADALEANRADIEEARRRAAPREDFGLYTSHRPAYRISLTEQAPTQALAIEQARRRVPAPAGWEVVTRAEPR